MTTTLRGPLMLLPFLAGCPYITDAQQREREDVDNDGFVGPEDCAPEDADVHPGATEVCNGLDDDCDDVTDGADAEGAAPFWPDGDGDGYGAVAGATVSACEAPTGYVDDATDCDDANTDANPGETEICDNGFDDDCDPDGAACRYAGTLAAADFGPVAGPGYGYSFAGGDLTGDGNADLLVGALGHVNGGGVGSGAVYLFNGPLQAQPSPETRTLTIEGDTPLSLGASVAVGDFGGTGDTWAAIGATGDAAGGGAVYLLTGGGTGTVNVSALARMRGSGGWVLGRDVDPFPAAGRDGLLASADNYSSVSGVMLFQSPAADATAELFVTDPCGHYHSFAAGDVDGDGVSEMVMGLPMCGANYDGFLAVIEGDTTGTMDYLAASSMRVAGDHADFYLGYDTVTADTDGDGRAELIASAPMEVIPGTPGGGAVVFDYAAGDVSASAAMATLPGVAGMVNLGVSIDAADLDGDGAQDLLLGDFYRDGGDGGVTLVYGPISGVMDLTDAPLFLGSASSVFGYRVRVVGDVTGGPSPEVAIGYAGPGQLLLLPGVGL